MSDEALSEQWAERFGGLGRLYGETAAARLPQLHLLVVGIGGVGSWSAEILARSGVGRLTLIDDDTIAASNMNRQIHTLETTIGRPKVAVMAERVAAINPACCIAPRQLRLQRDQLFEQLPITGADRPDGVIDAIDSVADKAALIYHCRRNRIPLLTVGGAGGVTDPTAVTIADLSRTEQDPLAAKVRALLRREYGFSRNPKRRFGVECVYSSEPPRYPQADGGVGCVRPGVAGLSLDCSYGYGASGGMTALFGMMAATRLINRLLQRSDEAAGHG